METPKDERPRSGDVIALSRYRAQLGRARKARRADALLSGPDPVRAIRALPGDELYYVIHEIGLRDAGDILVHARAEQVQALLDFAVWEQDRVSPERLGEWLEALAEAPPEKILEWVAGLDVELVALIIRSYAHVYNLTDGEPPDEPEGTFYSTPDRLFVLDVHGGERAVPDEENGGAAEGDEPPVSARAVIRIIDNLYRADKDLARRLLVGVTGEMDSELEEMAYRWRQGRMADLGFADYHEALEVYRELDPASVRVGESAPERTRVRPLDEPAGPDGPARAPMALIDRLGRTSPFARAVQALTSADDVADLHFSLVALTNRVLAADRVTPGDDEAVAAALGRMASTLDIAVEFLARGDEAQAAEAVRTVPLSRLHRLGVSLIGKVRRLALTLRRSGPFAAAGRDLAEHEDAVVLEAVTRVRPLFPGSLDDPPSGGERPFRSLADVARVTAAIEQAAAAQALLAGLGVRPEDVVAGALDDGVPDAGMLARTALVLRLLPGSSPAGDQPMRFRALDPREVREWERLLHVEPEGPMKLPETLKKKVKAILDAATPSRLAGAAAAVVDRWVAGLAPLEPVVVRKPPPRPRRK